MSAKEALAQRIATLRAHKARLHTKIDRVQAQIDELVALRDGLTEVQAGKIDALAVQGVVRVED